MLRLIEATAGQVLVGARVRHSVRHLYHRRRQHVPSQPDGRDPQHRIACCGGLQLGLLLFAHVADPTVLLPKQVREMDLVKIHVLCVAL